MEYCTAPKLTTLNLLIDEQPNKTSLQRATIAEGRFSLVLLCFLAHLYVFFSPVMIVRGCDKLLLAERVVFIQLVESSRYRRRLLLLLTLLRNDVS